MTKIPLQVVFLLTIAATVASFVDLVVVQFIWWLYLVVDVVDEDGDDAYEGEAPKVHQTQPESKEHAKTSNENENASDAADTSAIAVVGQQYPSAGFCASCSRIHIPFLCLSCSLSPLSRSLCSRLCSLSLSCIYPCPIYPLPAAIPPFASRRPYP